MSTMKERPNLDALNQAVGIFRDALNRVVDIFRNALFRRPEDSPQNGEVPNRPTPTPSADQSSYWLRLNDADVMLHKGDCMYVDIYSPDFPKNWTEYPTEDAARRSTSRQISKCQFCF